MTVCSSRPAKTSFNMISSLLNRLSRNFENSSFVGKVSLNLFSKYSMSLAVNILCLFIAPFKSQFSPKEKTGLAVSNEQSAVSSWELAVCSKFIANC